jgi:uncharacterized protein YgiM (DUF1202 family)
MALQSKYQELIDLAQENGVQDLQVREKDGVLYIDGVAHAGSVKDKLWEVYDKIDPNYASGDLVLDVNVTPAEPGSKIKVTTETTSLNIRKGPGTDQPIVGYAPHHSIITLISQTNDQWWLVRNVDGKEGYAYAKYLTLE